MKIIKGNKEIEATKEELLKILEKYNEIHLDIGTGDGRYVYKNAVANPTNFYIGVDPSKKQIEVYSKKAVKNKVENCLFVLGSIERLPEEIYGLADGVTIILPWGTLLKNITVPTKEVVDKLAGLLKELGCKLEILFGYTEDREPSEFARLNLPELSKEYIKEHVIPEFIMEPGEGFDSASLLELSKEELKNFESTWSKKLAFGFDRPLYHLILTK